MLSLIARDHGRALATAVAEQFIHERISDQREPQRMALRNRLGTPTRPPIEYCPAWGWFGRPSQPRTCGRVGVRAGAIPR